MSILDTKPRRHTPTRGARIRREEDGVAQGERSRENKGPAGGGVAGRGRRERRDRGGSDKGETDESGTAARWHEGCSEKRRETAKRDTKRQTPQGGRRLAHHTPLLKIPVWWRRAVLPSLPWVVCFLSFFLQKLPRTTLDTVLPSGAARSGRVISLPRRRGLLPVPPGHH